MSGSNSGICGARHGGAGPDLCRRVSDAMVISLERSRRKVFDENSKRKRLRQNGCGSVMEVKQVCVDVETQNGRLCVFEDALQQRR